MFRGCRELTAVLGPRMWSAAGLKLRCASGFRSLAFRSLGFRSSGSGIWGFGFRFRSLGFRVQCLRVVGFMVSNYQGLGLTAVGFKV